MEESKILFVDTNPSLCLELGKRLANEQLSFIHLHKSSEALRVLQSENVGLLILNIKSSSLPIDEIIPIIRGINKHMPIIITCDSNTPELEKQIRGQKIFYYHIKSFGISDLELAVKNALVK